MKGMGELSIMITWKGLDSSEISTDIVLYNTVIIDCHCILEVLEKPKKEINDCLGEYCFVMGSKLLEHIIPNSNKD